MIFIYANFTKTKRFIDCKECQKMIKLYTLKNRL